MQFGFGLDVGCGLDGKKSGGHRGLDWVCSMYILVQVLSVEVYFGFGEGLWKTGSGRFTELDPG